MRASACLTAGPAIALISHSHRFIFIHIPKTAGTSVTNSLAPYCNQPPRRGLRKILSHLPIPENPQKAAFRKHATAAWVRMKISARLFESYCRFSVVRNPFDRAVSYYHFLLEQRAHHGHRHIKHLSFDGYLDFLAKRRRSRNPTQLARLVDRRGNLLCDHILRFEQLDATFAALCRRLHIGAAIGLPRSNVSSHAHFLEYFEHRATRANGDPPVGQSILTTHSPFPRNPK